MQKLKNNRHSYWPFLLSGFLFLIALTSSAQVEIKTYSSNFKGFAPLERALDTCTLVVLGEVHRQPNNYPLFYQTFKFLHEKYKFNHLVFEYGTSMSWMLNQYWKGETEYYQILKDYVYAEDDYFNWVQTIKQAVNFKQFKGITLHGVELETQLPLALKVIDIQLKKHTLPPTLLAYADSLDTRINSATFHRDSLLTFANYFSSNWLTYQSTWEKSLNKQDFELCQEIVTGLARGLNYKKLRTINIQKAYYYRETFITTKLRKLLRTYPSAKFCTQLGQLHAIATPINQYLTLKDWHSATSRIKKDNERKVLSILYWYRNKEELNTTLFPKANTAKQVPFPYFLKANENKFTDFYLVVP